MRIIIIIIHSLHKLFQLIHLLLFKSSQTQNINSHPILSQLLPQLYQRNLRIENWTCNEYNNPLLLQFVNPVFQSQRVKVDGDLRANSARGDSAQSQRLRQMVKRQLEALTLRATDSQGGP